MFTHALLISAVVIMALCLLALYRISHILSELVDGLEVLTNATIDVRVTAPVITRIPDGVAVGGHVYTTTKTNGLP